MGHDRDGGDGDRTVDRLVSVARATGVGTTPVPLDAVSSRCPHRPVPLAHRATAGASAAEDFPGAAAIR
jgi:hypothetical protein